MSDIDLRPIRPDDCEQIYGWRNQDEVAAYMYSDHKISQEEHQAWFEQALTAENRKFWIIVQKGCPLGLANLYDMTPLDNANSGRSRCSWAFYLADQAARGQGVGQAVEFAILDYVFEILSFHKLWCEVLLENARVWEMHISFGFVREAFFRHHVCKQQIWHDVVGLGLLAEDWKRIRRDVLERLKAKGIRPAQIQL